MSDMSAKEFSHFLFKGQASGVWTNDIHLKRRMLQVFLCYKQETCASMSRLP